MKSVSLNIGRDSRPFVQSTKIKGEQPSSSASQTDRVLLNSYSARAIPKNSALLLKPQAKSSPDLGDIQWGIKTALRGIDVNFEDCEPIKPLNGRHASRKELVKFIEALKKESGIPFDYIDDGCYARAHLINESLRQNKINHQKLFVSGKSLEAKNSLMDVDWRFHVASLTLMKDDDAKVKPVVIDPSISDEPLSPGDWIKSFNKGDSIDVQVSNSKQVFPKTALGRLPFGLSVPLAVPVMNSFQRKLRAITKKSYTRPRSWWKPKSGGSFQVSGKRRYVFPNGLARTSQVAFKAAWELSRVAIAP